MYRGTLLPNTQTGQCKTPWKKQRGKGAKGLPPRCLLSNECVQTHSEQEQYNGYERNAKLLFSVNTEMELPANAPVRLPSAQLEELDYRKRPILRKGENRKSILRCSKSWRMAIEFNSITVKHCKFSNNILDIAFHKTV